ncbi:MAG: ribosome recycling factor [Flavobacteriales bacterium TMED123]|nr:MAG: ribosome recycling factor [Flavobacteriales bacterium TMED123]
MIEEVKFHLDVTKEQMEESIRHLELVLAKIRAGKANPQMLNSVQVDYYGSSTPISQMANVNTPDAQTISIQPWDKSVLQDVEKAIMEANLGFTPMNNGEMIMINIPPLTEERRLELVKQAKAEAEQCKISIRSVRQKANDEIKKLAKDGLSEDMEKDAEAEVQKLTDSYIQKTEDHFSTKEKEILTI